MGSSDALTLPLGDGLVDFNLAVRAQGDAAAAADKEDDQGSEAVCQVRRYNPDVYYVKGQPVAFTKKEKREIAALSIQDHRCERPCCVKRLMEGACTLSDRRDREWLLHERELCFAKCGTDNETSPPSRFSLPARWPSPDPSLSPLPREDYCSDVRE